MIVITTVGFGDYSPRTVFGRVFIFFATVSGISFFSVAANDILTMSNQLDNGEGSFRPQKKKGVNGYRGHVLLLGGGISSSNRETLETFIRSLCRGESTPEIVIMGTSLSQEVSRFSISLPTS